MKKAGLASAGGHSGTIAIVLAAVLILGVIAYAALGENSGTGKSTTGSTTSSSTTSPIRSSLTSTGTGAQTSRLGGVRLVANISVSGEAGIAFDSANDKIIVLEHFYSSENSSTSKLAFIDPATQRVIGSVNCTCGDRSSTYGLTYDSGNGYLYTAAGDGVLAIDPLTGKTVANISIRVLGSSYPLGFDPVHDQIFVSNFLDSNAVISIIDASINKVKAVVTIPTNFTLGAPVGFAYDSLNHDMYFYQGGYLGVIDTSNDSIVGVQKLTTGPTMASVVYDPDNNLLYVTHCGCRVPLFGPGGVVGIDPQTFQVVANMSFEGSPNLLGLDTNTNLLYVANSTITSPVPNVANPNHIVFNVTKGTVAIVVASNDTVVANPQIGIVPGVTGGGFAFDSTDGLMYVVANSYVYAFSAQTQG